MQKSKTRYHIPASLYKKILTVMPILTVDLVIVDRGKFLLLKRSIEPAKGRWWTPGGRVLKGEELESAARRKAKEETGLDVKIIKQIGAASFYWKRSMQGPPSHTPSVFFLAHPIRKNQKVRVNFNNSSAQWFQKIPKWLNRDLAKLIRKAGFK